MSNIQEIAYGNIIKKLKNPAPKYRPDVRWWLAEGLHTEETLKKDLDLLKDAGFGAVEFIAMEEPGADSSVYGWGSEEWIHDSHVLFQEATKRNMGISATCGTNWSNCNLTTIDPDQKAASKELDYITENMKPGQSRCGRIPECTLIMPGVSRQELVGVVAIRDMGIIEEKHYLDDQKCFVLTGQCRNGYLDWTSPEDGSYIIFYFYMHGTGQTAQPSQSISYTVNYIDRYGVEAFIEYWDREVITPKVQALLCENGRAMMYMDSLELATFSKGGQLWGYHFMDEFKRRRGYDLSPYLPFIVKDPGMMQPDYIYHYHMKDERFTEKLHNDLYQTMTEMYCLNMLKPMQEWCHSHEMELRSEISYGLPFEISEPGKYVDDVETESLEFASQIECYRGMAGTAHIYDKIYSSETGANMMNYKMGLDFYTQIIYTQFAAGVTRTVLHGYASIAGAESSTYWPGHEGMWPIFSERFGSRQPSWNHYQDWTSMISRYQMLLRQGRPRMDLAILRMDYNFNNLLFNGDEKAIYENQLMRGHEGIYWKDMQLQDHGYTWDYFAPQLLEETFVDYSEGLLMPQGPVHRIKCCEYVREVDDQSDILCVLQVLGKYPRTAFSTRNQNILTLTRSWLHKRIVYVYNMQYTEKEPFSFTLSIEGHGRPYQIDCWNGTISEVGSYRMEEYRTMLDIVLSPGDASLYIVDCLAPDTLHVTNWDSNSVIYQANKLWARIYKNGSSAFHMSDGAILCVETSVPAPVNLPVWELDVEDWNEGDRITVREDRGNGCQKSEVYFETRKDNIHVGKTTLIPWKEIESIGPSVSGVGHYRVAVNLRQWEEGLGAVLSIENIHKNTFAVFVNGKKAGAANFDSLAVDISSYLKQGMNEIKVEVSSTLNNRLLDRGYFTMVGRMTATLAANANNGNDETTVPAEEDAVSQWFHVDAKPQEYGMTGKAEIIFYKKVLLASDDHTY